MNGQSQKVSPTETVYPDLKHHRTQTGEKDYKKHRPISKFGPSLEVDAPVTSIMELSDK